MATETGIRSYGPGKFNYIIDEYVYEAALNQGTPDEEISHEGFGWFALVELDDSARKFIREFAADEEDELTSEEEDLLDDSKALILHERSDGIVEVDWYDTLEEARKVWADLEDELADDEDDDDEGDLEESSMSKIPELEKLATEQVGANNSSLIFVTEEGVVRAVFTRRSDMDAAIGFAEHLPSRNAVVVENHTGVAWENAESERRQEEEDE